MRIRIVDAFTDQPFRGNPAAVVLLDRPAPDGWMQALAAENNLSETAYLVPAGADGDAWGLRWFTPTVEVDLCGHATLASAHVLFAEVGADAAVLRFATRSGDLFAPLRKGEQFHLIVTNPPYVPTAEIDRLAADVREHEPRSALDGGVDGLDVIRRIVADAARVIETQESSRLGKARTIEQ